MPQHLTDTCWSRRHNQSSTNRLLSHCNESPAAGQPQDCSPCCRHRLLCLQGVPLTVIFLGPTFLGLSICFLTQPRRFQIRFRHHHICHQLLLPQLHCEESVSDSPRTLRHKAVFTQALLHNVPYLQKAVRSYRQSWHLQLWAQPAQATAANMSLQCSWAERSHHNLLPGTTCAKTAPTLPYRTRISCCC